MQVHGRTQFMILLRSAGSAALNFGEAQGTNTVKDNIHKLSISLKESKESRST